MQPMRVTILLSIAIGMIASLGLGQEYGKPDQGQPGDEMVQRYLKREAEKIHEKFAQDVESREKWEKLRPAYRQEYLYMLGLWPMPEKTPLQATVTGTLEGDGYVVDMVHYQSVPGLYVTGNLYRPSRVEAGQRLPAVLYVCGHPSAGATATRPPTSPTASGSPGTATSAWCSTRCSWARSPPFITARTARAAGGGIRAVTRRRASSA